MNICIHIQTYLPHFKYTNKLIISFLELTNIKILKIPIFIILDDNKSIDDFKIKYNYDYDLIHFLNTEEIINNFHLEFTETKKDLFKNVINVRWGKGGHRNYVAVKRTYSILELEKTAPTTVDSSKMVSRIVIYFNLIPIKKMIDSGEIPSNAEYNLRLFNAHSSEIPLSYDVYAYPLSQSIQMGIGKADDNPINSEGVTWLWPDTTGSIASSTWDGGNWLTASDGGLTNLVASQSYEYTTADINMDVTTLTKELLLKISMTQGE